MCTGVRFTDPEGHLYFGRNLDWIEDYGEGIVITPRGAKVPAPFLGAIEPKYASIGMAIVVGGAPCYFDVANEGTVNVAAYEFPLYLTANFKTVPDVREA